ncbi:MAG: hypothetical protein ABIZ56_07020 [Chthoniobacteraceae bacterium]
MKLGKEEIQKIVLGGVLLAGLVYVYFSMLLGPLVGRQALVRKSITDLDPQITAAQAQMKKTAAIEASAPKATETLAQVKSMIPEGSPVAWFPTRLGDFFKKQGVDKAATRMNNEVEDKNLPGFRRISWSVDLPRVDFIPFAAALAQLENEEPLVEIGTIQVDTSREDAASQHVVMTVNNLVNQ